MKILAIAATNLRRTFRERTVWFAVFVLPMLLILLLGLLYGQPAYRVGLVVGEGPLAQELAASIRDADGIEVNEFADTASLLDAIAHDDRDAGFIIPSGYDAALRAGDDVAIEFTGTSEATSFGAASVVDAAVKAQAAQIGAARFAGAATQSSFEEGMAAAAEAATSLGEVEVAVVGVGNTELKEIGMFDAMAYRMLALFVFLTGLSAGAAGLIRSRQLGMSRRMLGTPTSAKAIISGETAGHFLAAFVQALVIVIMAAIVFGVDWGNWAATLAIVIVFSLVAAGAGMLLGSMIGNAQLADSIAVFVALAFAMVGGSMGGTGSVPVPHAWANVAFDKVMVDSAGIADIGAELGALALYALVFIGIAAFVFRRTVTRSQA